MAVTATLLGSATGSGLDLTVPITTNQPAGTLVGVYAMANTGPSQFAETQGFRSVPTDTEAGTWSFTSPQPFVDNTGDAAGAVGSFNAGNIMSAIRTAGNPLVAGGSGPQPRAGCKTCGNMLLGLAMATGGGGGSGDSVSVHWFNTNTDAPSHTVAFVVAYTGLLDSIVTTDQSQYGNGDTYPATSLHANALNWTTDLGAGFVPTPTANCAVTTLVGAYGTSGWTPVNGSTVATVTDGTIFLALGLNTFAASGVKVEPGGTFGGASTYAAANYQTVGLA